MSKAFPGGSKADHGSRAGYQMHKAQRSVVCQPCRQAQNDYMREYAKSRYNSGTRRQRYLIRKAVLPLD